MKRKGTNKILVAFLLSMLMVLSMGMSVFAGEGSATKNISITNAVDGSTYSVYQVMTAVDAGTNAFQYTVKEDFAGFFENNTDGYGLTAQNEITKDGKVISGDARWTNTNSSEAAKLATALSKYAIANKIAPIAEIQGTTPVAEPIGYYVIAETASGSDQTEVATKPILVDLTEKDAAIELKKDTTHLDKVIVEGESEVKQNNVSIGDRIDYKITTRIPTYEANVDKESLAFILTDTFSAGLTYNGDLSIEGFTAADYTAAYNEETQELTITFTQDAIYANQGKEVEAAYSATLNDKAKVDSTEGNPNDVKLEYTNNTNEKDKHKTLEDETKTYTYGFKIHKVDKVEDSKNLEKAKFTVADKDGNAIKFTKKDDGTYVVDENGTVTEIETGKDGLATVAGLKEGQYTLSETQAPDGYTKLAQDIVVTITAKRDKDGKETGEAQLTTSGAGDASAEGGAKVVDEEGNETGAVESTDNTININVLVKDSKGISLPETGRNSALYCMIGGAALILFGALYYIIGARRRRA